MFVVRIKVMPDTRERQPDDEMDVDVSHASDLTSRRTSKNKDLGKAERKRG